MLWAGCAAVPAAFASVVKADLVILGGVIHTGVEGREPAEAVASRSGRIILVGSKREARPLIDAKTRVVRIEKGAVFPGFVDAHAHLFEIGERERTRDLSSVGSIRELVKVVGEEVAQLPPGAALLARGWLETHWPEARFPDRADLDPVSTRNPVILIRADGHALLANTAALERAGISADARDPDGGRFERDGDGRLTGMIIDRARERIAALIAPATDGARVSMLEAGARLYESRGWTGLHNMAVTPDDVKRIEHLASSRKIGLRVYNAVNAVQGWHAVFASGARSAAQGRVITRGVKLFVDGALGSRGAALLTPYQDAASNSGILRLDEAAARGIFDRALREGIQIAAHAIGDRANRLALDWMSAAFVRVPASEWRVAQPRWRIEHAQVIAPSDIPRFAQLGVIASMQPSHAISDLYFAPARLGPGRLAGAYAWRSLIDSGAIVAGGSDAPVERGDPLVEFYAAVARRDLKGHQGRDWHPQESVTRSEALKMLTLWPAIASFQEADLGTIEVGKKADFTGFSADLMTIPVQSIPRQRAILTVVEGRVLHEDTRS